jgi:AraC-like DNA-binding protein
LSIARCIGTFGAKKSLSRVRLTRVMPRFDVPLPASLPLAVNDYADRCARLGTPPRVKELAVALHMSRWCLCRAWAEYSTIPLSDHLRRRQVALAERLLEETADPIATVAGRAGFASTRQFHRVFRRLLNMTPDQFRESKRLRAARLLYKETSASNSCCPA